VLYPTRTRAPFGGAHKKTTTTPATTTTTIQAATTEAQHKEADGNAGGEVHPEEPEH
jgi:hypothetical protein